jgi:hypothetical protein
MVHPIWYWCISGFSAFHAEIILISQVDLSITVNVCETTSKMPLLSIAIVIHLSSSLLCSSSTIDTALGSRKIVVARQN